MDNPNLDLGSSLGNKPAPDFRLHNQFGQPMSLSQFRGKVVMLAFEDSECTTVCPLTTQSMLEAKQLLGPAGNQVQLLGVDANPDAISTADVLSYSRTHGLVNQWNFLTGSLAELKATWKLYDIAVQIEQDQIDHTPALFVIDQQGRERKLYLTQMAYSSVGQSAAGARAGDLRPAARPPQGGQPAVARVHLRAGPLGSRHAAVRRPQGGTVTLGPGPAAPGHVLRHLAVRGREPEVRTDRHERLRGGGAPRRPAVADGGGRDDGRALGPGRPHYLAGLGTTLNYPVGLDTTGRVADGYEVQDQPWFALVSASGKITWSHDGWLPLPALEAAVKKHAG